MQASLSNSESDEPRAIDNTSPTTETLDEENLTDTMYTDDENNEYTPVLEGPNPPPLEYAAIPGGAAVDMLIDLASPSPSDRATVEDVEIYRDGYWIEPFPKPAGTKKGKAMSEFEKLREMQKDEGDKPWAPFESEEEWELARWMMTSGTSRKKMDALLKLDMVRISQHQIFNIKLTSQKNNRFAMRLTLPFIIAGPCCGGLTGFPSVHHGTVRLSESQEIFWITMETF
jgi:hypothetical protein